MTIRRKDTDLSMRFLITQLRDSMITQRYSQNCSFLVWKFIIHILQVITVEGPPAVGKTAFAKALAEDLDMKYFPAVSFFPHFYHYLNM